MERISESGKGLKVSVAVLFCIATAILAVLVPLEYWRVAPLTVHWVKEFRAELISLFEQPSSQWMGIVGITGYYACFFGYTCLSADRRSRPLSWSNWVHPALFIIITAAYFVSYARINDTVDIDSWIGRSMSTDPAVFLAGMTLGMATAAAKQWSCSRGMSPVVFTETLLLALTFIGAVCAVCRPDIVKSIAFQYLDAERWTGPFNNPNTYGLVVGATCVLAVGLLIRNLSASRPNGKRVPLVVFCTITALVSSIGLLKSFSRGAWVGTTAGMTLLLLVLVRDYLILGGKLSLVRRNVTWLALSAVFVVALVFSALQHVDSPLAQRLSSISNRNDFSWRNRITTGTGSLQMLAESPVRGYGWNRPAVVYHSLFMPWQLVDGRAFILNDYLVLATTLGVPALILFLCCICKLWQRSWPRGEPPTCDAITHISRAALVVLLIGFLFDSGLFKMALASCFWLLVELGRPHVCAELDGSSAKRPI
jgi:O-antigen ligase